MAHRPGPHRGDRPMRDLQEMDMAQIQLVADDLVAAHRLHSRPSGGRLIVLAAAAVVLLALFAPPYFPPAPHSRPKSRISGATCPESGPAASKLILLGLARDCGRASLSRRGRAVRATRRTNALPPGANSSNQRPSRGVAVR